MIVRCPHCSARYNISRAQIGPTGRTLKCANCGESWHQAPVADEERKSPPVAPHAAVSPLQSAAATQHHKWMWPLISGLIALLICAAGFLTYRFVLAPAPHEGFKELKVDPVTKQIKTPTGLVLSDIQRHIRQEGTVTVLEFTGRVTNINKVATPIPEIRVQLLDKQGVELDFWPADMQQSILKPGETATWKVRFLNPPLDKLNKFKAFFR